MTESLKLLQSNSLSPHRQCLDARFVNFIADAVTCGRFDRALSAHRHRRLDDVLFPVARRGRDIPRQGKARQSRQCDVVRSTDARLEHPTAPYRYVMLNRVSLNQSNFCVPPDAPELD